LAVLGSSWSKAGDPDRRRASVGPSAPRVVRWSRPLYRTQSQ